MSGPLSQLTVLPVAFSSYTRLNRVGQSHSDPDFIGMAPTEGVAYA
jgi:hypothetical protein